MDQLAWAKGYVVVVVVMGKMSVMLSFFFVVLE